MSVKIINDLGDVEVKDPETGYTEVFSNAEYIRRRSILLQAWLTTQNAFEKAKKEELAARKIASDFMHDADKSGKQETVKLGNGYEAKLKIPLTYGFVKNEKNEVDKLAIETALEIIANEGSKEIADKLVKWTPVLSLTEYKALTVAHKEIIDPVIVVKEGTPVLSIKEPKA